MRGCSPERVEARGKTERLVVQRAGPTRLCLGKSLLCALLVKFSNTRRSQNSQGDGTHRGYWSRPAAGMELKKGRKAYTAIAWVCGHARGPFGSLNYGRGTIA